MKIILLVQTFMTPVPDSIIVLNNWGRETVVVGDVDDYAGGDVMMLEGDPSNFVSWLSPFAAVWTTTNPMFGKWEALHIKSELTKATV